MHCLGLYVIKEIRAKNFFLKITLDLSSGFILSSENIWPLLLQSIGLGFS